MKKVIILISGLVATGAIEAAPGQPGKSTKIIDMYRIPEETLINSRPPIREHEIHATDCNLLGYFYTGEKGYLRDKLRTKGGLHQCGNIISKDGSRTGGIAVYVYDEQHCPYARKYAHDLSNFDFNHFKDLKLNASKYGANSDPAMILAEIFETLHEGCPAQQAGPAE